jgi:predicted short-subunit dehydrogenase-like oxidoreductase (DUF2520 family)
VGRGRLGTALARGLSGAGHDVAGPLSRVYGPADLREVEAVLLCVPDGQIAAAAAVLAERWPSPSAAPLVGHCSGATALSALGRAEAFSLHPLMTVTPESSGPPWPGAVAAVSGSTERAQAMACRLAGDLGLRAVPISDADRVAYHAAASMASNFLVTLEVAAERLAAGAGAGRELLVPLVRQTVENWSAAGAAALTGPIARGDEATVARQRHAVAERTPDLVDLFDALADATRELAGRAPAAGVAS